MRHSIEKPTSKTGGTSLRPSAAAAAASSEPPARSHRATHDAPAPVLMTAKQVAAQFYGVSERKFQLMRVEGLVPPPVALGPRCLRWVRSELEQAVAALPRSSTLTEPETLRRGRIDATKAGA